MPKTKPDPTEDESDDLLHAEVLRQLVRDLDKRKAITRRLSLELEQLIDLAKRIVLQNTSQDADDQQRTIDELEEFLR